MVRRPRCDRNWAGQMSSKGRTAVERSYHIIHRNVAVNVAQYVAKNVKALMPTVESSGFLDSCRKVRLLGAPCSAPAVTPGARRQGGQGGAFRNPRRSKPPL